MGATGELPAGTVTLLFTDIEGSTQLLRRLGPDYDQAQADHRRLLRAAFAAHRGLEVDTQGDAFFVAFARASDALAAALEGQRALLSHPWAEGGAISVRMALHTGEPVRSAEGYVGLDVHRAARICSVGHGGQVLVSQSTHELLSTQDVADAHVTDLGEHRLKDFDEPQHLYQLSAPGMPDAFPPLRTRDPGHTNLPAELTPLVGREAEVAEIVGRLGHDAVRLLSLTGPGGTGKTRLALAAAAALQDGFPDGVTFVDLSQVRTAAAVAATIARTLGLPEDPDRPPVQVVGDFLAARRALLVLDNFEQVLDAAADVPALLEAAPAVKVLVTSRGPLRVAAEHDYGVPPLSADEAAALFVQRARAVRRDFELDEDGIEEVRDICASVDRLPLAVELAGARVRYLTISAIRHRLDRRMTLLTGGSRELPSRQQTLRNTIDWSHELLGDHHQRVFARLAVFAGGAAFEAAEVVCEASFDDLAALVDVGLVRSDATDRDEPRLTMLETIREYAIERLEADADVAATRRRHAEEIVRMAEELAPQVRGGPRQEEILARLETEHDNIRAAMAWMAAAGEGELRARLVLAVRDFWTLHGHFVEGSEQLEWALANVASPEARAKLLFTAAVLAQRRGDPDRAEALAREQDELCRAHGDRLGSAYAAIALGFARKSTDAARGRVQHERALALARELGDPQLTSIAVTNFGDLELNAGDYAAAIAYSREGVALARARRDHWGLALSLTNLAFALLLGGDEIEAVTLLEEGLLTCDRVGLRELVAVSLEGLAAVAAREDPEGSARLVGAVDAIMGELGSRLEPVEWRLRERTLAVIGEKLDEDALTSARAAGAAWTLAEATAAGLAAARR